MGTVRYASRLPRDYKREKPGPHGKRVDAELLETVSMLAKDEPCRHGLSITRLKASRSITAIAGLPSIYCRASSPTSLPRLGVPHPLARSQPGVAP